MPDSLDQIFADSKTLTNRERDLRLMALFDSGRENARVAVERILHEFPKTPMFLGTVVQALALTDFGPLTEMSLAALRKSPENRAALEFVAHASLQSLPHLRPFLRELIDLSPNWTTYYATWPWRESGTTQFELLRKVAESGAKFWSSAQTRIKARAAVDALFETRELECLHFLSERLDGAEMLSRLHLVGLEPHEEGFRSLFTEQAFHLRFPPNYFDDILYPAGWLPMPGLETAAVEGHETHVFGGMGTGECRGCGQRLHNLLALEPIPASAGVSGLGRLSLETRLSCLGSTTDAHLLFYEHDQQGNPHESNLRPRERWRPEYVAGPLRRAEVSLAVTPDRSKWQDWGMSNSRENLNRLGGYPAWVQQADYSTCPKCDQTMVHLLQVDSDLPCGDDGDLWMWGDGGCCYVGWCDECKISGIHWQST